MWAPDVPGLPLPVTHTASGQLGDLPSPLLGQMWKQRSDPVLHIELRRWADLMLVAPLDANTLGKVASGLCDNLLVSDPPSTPFTSPRGWLRVC